MSFLAERNVFSQKGVGLAGVTLVCAMMLHVFSAVSLMSPLFQSRVYLGMTTLKELIVKRPSRQFQYLHVLLDLSSHEKEKVNVRCPC